MADSRIRIQLGRHQQIKDLKVALQCLSKIGAELLIEGFTDRLILTTINTSKSASFSVTFYSSFFDGYSVESPLDKVHSAVLLKHVLATFRTQKILSMTINVEASQCKLIVTVVGDNRITKTYELDGTSSDVMNATVDKESYPTQVIAEAGELNRLLNSFQSSLDEITIIANPERTASAASMHRSCQLQSFYDPKKGGRDMLHTSLEIDTQSVFLGYRHRSELSSDVTFNVKDFRSIVTLSEHQGSNIMLRLDQAGMPVVAETHASGLQPDGTYTAELVLATLTESQLLTATTHQHEQAPQQVRQEQQVWAPQQPQQPASLAGQDWGGGQQGGRGQQHAGAAGRPDPDHGPTGGSAWPGAPENFDDDDAEDAGEEQQHEAARPRAPGNAMEYDDPDPEQLPRTGHSPMPGPKPSGPVEHPAAHAQQQAVHSRGESGPVQGLAAAEPAYGSAEAAAQAYAPMQRSEEQAYGQDGDDEDEDDVLPSTPDVDTGMDQERGLLGPGFIAD